MKIKSSKLNIPEKDPFAEDILERSESARVLTQLISTIDESFVLAIDSSWGTGKTTFLEMWLQDLKNKKYPCLYLNAWKSDFNNDALVSLVGEIESGIDNLILDNGDKISAIKHFRQAKKIGAALVKVSLPEVIKCCTGVDADKIIKEVKNKLASDKFQKYDEDKDTIIEFKKSLCGFVKTLTGKDCEKKPLLIFIDELDRCRPTYALELLEKVKHFFDIEGIIFILAMDKQQIGHSIQSVYGTGMDVDGYLRRFIDLDYTLPVPDNKQFCNALFRKFGFEEFFDIRSKHISEFRSDKSDLLEVLVSLFTMFGFSLRVQEQCFSRLSIVFRTTKSNNKLYPFFLGALIALKAFKPELYSGYINGKINADKVLDTIKQAARGRNILNYNLDDKLEAYFLYGPSNSEEKARVIDIYLAENHNNISDENISKEKQAKAIRIKDNFKFFKIHVGNGMLPYLARKIEIADDFV